MENIFKKAILGLCLMLAAASFDKSAFAAKSF